MHGELVALAELVDDLAVARCRRSPTSARRLPRLRTGAMAFMATLQAARSVGGAVDEALFIAFCNGVTERLEDFRAAQRRYSQPIVGLIEGPGGRRRAGPPRGACRLGRAPSDQPRWAAIIGCGSSFTDP